MKRNDPLPVSILDHLAFPAMGCVPLSAMVTVDFVPRRRFGLLAWLHRWRAR